jgi:hypothetical protein
MRPIPVLLKEITAVAFEPWDIVAFGSVIAGANRDTSDVPMTEMLKAELQLTMSAVSFAQTMAE